MLSSLDRIRRHLSDLQARLLYQWFGPTTVHLHLEFALLLCLALLTVANLQSVTSQPWSHGDTIYLCLVAMWQSRYLFFRWLCLWDPTSIHSPTFLGLLSLVLTAHVSAGHTFDRPNQVVLNNCLSGGGGGGSSNTGGGGGGGGSFHVSGGSAGTPLNTVSIFQLLPTGSVYAWHLLLNTIWYPLLHPIVRNASSYLPSLNPWNYLLALELRSGGGTWKLSSSLLALQQSCCNLLLQYGPTLPFVLPHATLLWYGVSWYHFMGSSQHMSPSTTTITSLNKRTASVIQDELEASRAYGAYQKPIPPTWGDVGLVVTTVSGGLIALLWYRRLLLPFPDQVAGGTVVRDLRHETRGAAHKKVSRKDALAMGLTPMDAAWPERARPLEDRCRLEWTVRVFRCFETLLLCGVLPRTSWICRATGHCAAPQIWELYQVLYPIGITSPIRTDGNYSTSLFVGSWMSALWMLLSITAVTLLVLLAQSIVLNKTYLSIAAYISSEWEPVEESQLVGTPSPSMWDPRRKYKKGDVVLHVGTGQGQLAYRATTNSPETRPSSNLSFRLEKTLNMRRELGHLSASTLLCKTTLLQSSLVGLDVLLLLLRWVTGHSTKGCTAALAAHVVAAIALVCAGTPRTSKLVQLNAEIQAT